MTDEEANALDELMSNTDLELGPNGTGFFSNKGFQMIAIDENAARILKARRVTDCYDLNCRERLVL